MDLNEEILIKILESKCCTALHKIKTIIENDKLSDSECIEEIVRVFDELGSDGDNRYDLG